MWNLRNKLNVYTFLFKFKYLKFYINIVFNLGFIFLSWCSIIDIKQELLISAWAQMTMHEWENKC